MYWYFDFGLETDFAGFPLLGDLHEDADYQTQQGGFVGEETDDAGAAFDLGIGVLPGLGQVDLTASIMVWTRASSVSRAEVMEFARFQGSVFRNGRRGREPGERDW